MTSYRVVVTMDENDPIKLFDNDLSFEKYLFQNSDECYHPENDLFVKSKYATILFFCSTASKYCYISTGTFLELKISYTNYYRDFSPNTKPSELTTVITFCGKYRKTTISDSDNLAVFSLFEYIE